MFVGDILYTIIIFAAFFYMYITGTRERYRQKIRADWSNTKCKPQIIPFASYYGPKGTSTTDNFKECLIKMSEGNMLSLLAPFGNVLSGIAEQSASITTSTQNMGDMVDSIQSKTSSMFSTHNNLLVNVVSGVYKILANIKDTTERTVTVNEYLKAMLDEQSRILYSFTEIA